ncbi:hypothetical protein M569_15283, partial [Genlisea aurea]
WRHVLGPKDIIDQIDIALGKYVITLSRGGTVLRAWSLPDGQMVWESTLLGSRPSKPLVLIPKNLNIDKDNIIFVFGNGHIHAVSSIDGEVIWKKELASDGFEAHELVHPVGGDSIYAFGLIGSSEVVFYRLNIKSGELLDNGSILFPGGFSGDLSFVSDDTAVVMDASGTNLVVVHLKNGQLSFHQRHVSDLIQDSSRTAVILPSKVPGLFILKSDASNIFFKVGNEGELNVLEKLDHANAVSDSLPLSEGRQAFALVQQAGDSEILLTVKSSDDWTANLVTEKIQMGPQRGHIQKVFINNYVRTDRSNGFRVLIVMEDYSLVLLQQGEIVWSREDGLASIIDVKASELPFEKDGVSVANVEHGLFEWLQGHLLKIKGSLMLASPDELAVIQKMRLGSSEKTKMTRDRNGFRKLLVVLTRAGKILALHTGDGRIVWSLMLNSLWKSPCKTPRWISLHQWQDPHHHALDENPSVLVAGMCDGSSDSAGLISVVDVYTGNEITHVGPIHSIAQIITLQFTDSLEQRLHLLLDSDGRAHLYPRTADALGIFRKELGNIYWYSVDTDEGILRGHGLQKTCILDVADEFCYEAKHLWSIVLPPETERIISTASRNPNEVVHTQTKVTADQDVWYKYVSKNLLFLATVSPKGVGPIGSVTPDESSLFIYVINTVSGRILHRIAHHGAQGPVNAVFSENWVVYHCFNLRAHRYEMNVVEIYDEARAENKDIAKLVFGAHNLTSPVTAYSRLEASVKSQSYFFTHSVKSMVVTSTSKGITSKQVLVGTIGDQILALDKRFLDPRRTVNPSQAEKEEGIIPLTDSLPIIPQSYVTHGVKVEGLRNVVTFPARLESTALVFAHGVDLFFARLAPSKTFDSLTEEFSYALLLLTIAALLVAIFVTWIWSEKKELQDKWR